MNVSGEYSDILSTLGYLPDRGLPWPKASQIDWNDERQTVGLKIPQERSTIPCMWIHDQEGWLGYNHIRPTGDWLLSVESQNDV